MKTLIKILKGFVLLCGIFITQIQNYIGFYQVLTNNGKETMNSLQLFQLIALPIFVVGIFFYFELKFKKLHRKQKEYTDVSSETIIHIEEIKSSVNKRKMSKIFFYIQDLYSKLGYELKDEKRKWLTDLELQLLKKQRTDLTSKYKDVEKELNSDFDEHN
jgi:hypothetical protein